MPTAELMSLISSIAALILAIVAIALSIAFFRMTSELSTSAKEAAKGIGSSVEKLEKLFDHLYADTFSMMRDTVSDMRKHIWPDESVDAKKLADEAEKLADKKVNEVKKNIDADLSQLLRKQRVTDKRLSTVTDEMRELIDRAITDSRRVEREASEETTKKHVLLELRHLLLNKPHVTADEVVTKLRSSEVSVISIVEELKELAREGRIGLSETPLGPETEITLTEH